MHRSAPSDPARPDALPRLRPGRFGGVGYRLVSSLAFAGFLAAAAASAGEPGVADEVPVPPNAEPPASTLTRVGWALPIGCASDATEPAARAAACADSSRAEHQPLRFEGANQEVFFLHGIDAKERDVLGTGRAVEVSGAFAWQGDHRVLRVDRVSPADPAAVDAARTTQPQYVMQQYFLTILQPGPQGDVADEVQAELMRGHFAHIATQAQAGTLRIVGPFGDHEPRTHSGLYLYDVETLEDAEALSQLDPAVAAGYFAATTIPWWGPASLTY